MQHQPRLHKMKSAQIYLSVFLLTTLCFSTHIHAQDSRFPSGVVTPNTILPVIPQREPGSPASVLYVPDGKGNYVAAIVGGITWAEFDALLRSMYRPNSGPLYSIQSLTADGQVTNNIADLTIKFRIQTQNEPSVLCIPLGLKSGIFQFDTDLSESIQYDGPSDFSIIANPQGNGYDIILRAKSVDLETDHVPESIVPEVTEIQETPTEPPTPPPPSTESAETPPEFEPAEENQDEREAVESDIAYSFFPLPSSSLFPHPLPVDRPTSLLPDPTSSESESEILRQLHTVTLRLAFPVAQPSVSEFQFKAEFPAALSSQVQLVVPQPHAVVMQTKGGSLLQTLPSDEQTTLFVFQGTQSDFEVQWYEKQNVPVPQRAVLQVEDGRVIANVSPTGVMFDATIPVKSSGGTFDSFSLRLPRGAVYRPIQSGETTEYQVEVMNPGRAGQDDPSSPVSQVLLFRLSQPTEGPVLVRFHAETSLSQSLDGLFEVGGFEVIGAEKQFGRLSVIVPPETHLRRQNESRSIRPSIDTAMIETEGIVTEFEYYEQPCSLLVQAVPQATRVNLEPEYQIEIQRNRAVLKAKLSYTILGSCNQLSVNMNGWRLTSLEPGYLIHVDEQPLLENGSVIITLREPVGKNVELIMRAERDFDSDEGFVHFPFPVPEADFIQPAFVAVIPADHIELSDDESRPIVGMSQKSLRSTPLQMELPASQQGALVYQMDHPARAEFCAKLRLHQKKMTVTSHTELTLQSGDPVIQTLDFTVEYERVSLLTLAVPSELDDQEDLRVLFESRELKLFDVIESDMTNPEERLSSTDSVVLKQLRLPDAFIGSFQLTLEFKLNHQIRNDLDKEQRPKTFPVRIPIVLPRDGQLIQETVRVQYPHGLQINHSEEATGWKKKEFSGVSVPSSQFESFYQTDQAMPFLLLGAAFQNTDTPGATTIEKSWVRSWLQDFGRIDYACYQVSTNASHLTVKLPVNFQMRSLIVKVDNRTVTVEQNDQNAGELRIPLLPPSNETSPSPNEQSLSLRRDLSESETLRTLEIKYEVPMRTATNRLTLVMPTFPSEVLVRPGYFQVFLPNSRHLISNHPDWIPQYQWQWDSRCYSRKPILSQQELEGWIGVSHVEPISPTLNNYLFIAFHPETEVQLGLADRSTLVLVSSGLILLFGLILIYFPRMRYPGVLFTFLVLFVSAFAYHVTMGALFLQAGIIGLVLVLIASFLYRMFVSTDSWREPASVSLPVAAQVKGVPSDQSASASRNSVEENIVAVPDAYRASERKHGDEVPQDDTNGTSQPVSENDRGHHA